MADAPPAGTAPSAARPVPTGPVPTRSVLAAFLRRAIREERLGWVAGLFQLGGLALALLSQAFLGRLVDAAPNTLLGRYAGHYAGYLLVGVAALDLQHTVTSALSNRIREAQLAGSLESLLATPTPVPLVLLGVAIPDVAGALVRLLLYVLLGGLVFGLHAGPANLLAFVVVLALALAAFAALGLIGAALTMLLRRRDPVSLLVATASMIAGGVFYPRAVLPPLLRWIAPLLPITPALDGLRAAAVQGVALRTLGGPIAHLLGFVLGGGAVGVWLLRHALTSARSDGSLTGW